MTGFLQIAAAGLALATATVTVTAPGEKETKRGDEVVVSGIITTRDPDGTIVVMPEGKNEGFVLIVTPKTRIVRGGHDIPFAKVKAGDLVVVSRLPDRNDVLLTVIPRFPRQLPVQ